MIPAAAHRPGTGGGARLRPFRLPGTWCRALPLLLLLLASACSRTPEGRLEILLRVDSADLGGFDSLALDPDWAGASRHPHRDAGWRRIPLLLDRLELGASGDALLVAAGPLPIGHYDRLLVSTPIVAGRDDEGRVAELTSHIEPIARGFELRAGSSTRVAIDLIVRPAPRGALQPEIFVKHAELLEPVDDRQASG